MANNPAAERWLLLGLVLLLVPVVVVSILQATRSTAAGRIATHPPANLFAKPLDRATLPGTVGGHRLTRPDQATVLPHGQIESVVYVPRGEPDGSGAVRVVVLEGRVVSLADYEAASGLREPVRVDRFGCGRMDRLAQCVGLLRGGFLVTIAVDPVTDVPTLADFSNRLYEELPGADD